MIFNIWSIKYSEKTRMKVLPISLVFMLLKLERDIFIFYTETVCFLQIILLFKK